MIRFILSIFILTEACIIHALITGHQGSHDNTKTGSPEKSGKRQGHTCDWTHLNHLFQCLSKPCWIQIMSSYSNSWISMILILVKNYQIQTTWFKTFWTRDSMITTKMMIIYHISRSKKGFAKKLGFWIKLIWIRFDDWQ